MGPLNRYPKFLEELDTVTISDDFFWAVTVHQWTTLAADTTPTVTTPDAVNGVVRLFTDTTDNNEVAIRSTVELFKFGTNREIYCRAKVQYAENDTNKANVFVGFGSAIGANFLVDNGAGVRTSGDVFGLYKIDGGTKWIAVTQTNGTAVTTTSSTTAGGSAAQVIEMEAKETDGVTMTCTWKIDGVYLNDANGNRIIHKAVISGATEMNVGLYVKTGGGAGGETVDMDYICAQQPRI
jgi:hypothetical protein